MPPASHQVSATSLKLLIQQIHPHVRVERDSGMCVARDLYELWGRGPYTRMFVARRARTAGNRFARDDKEPGPSWGKQLPGERPRETAET